MKKRTFKKHAVKPRAKSYAKKFSSVRKNKKSGLNNSALLQKIGKIFNNRIRPMLNADGGDAEIISLKGKSLTIRLTGACGSCPYGLMTLQYGIQANLDEALPTGKIIVKLEE